MSVISKDMIAAVAGPKCLAVKEGLGEVCQVVYSNQASIDVSKFDLPERF
jgi:hypothetical protein